MPKVYQQILRGPRSSERGIRYKRLKPSEVDELRRKAAKLVSQKPDVSQDEMPEVRRRLFLFEGVKAMLVAVTKQPVGKPGLIALVLDGKPVVKDGEPVMIEGPEPDLADESLWQPLDVGTLTMPGPYSYDELFEAPDDFHLRTLFSYNHEANAADIDAIVKKERTV